MRLASQLQSLGHGLVVLGIVAGGAAAQSTPAPERTGLQLPPLRPLGTVTATAKETFPIVTNLRPLADGRVLVNDPAGRRVLLYDAGLQNFTVVADSTSATANAYGGRVAGLISYKADSTLFVDPQSLSMLVLDPNGKVGRVMSVPNAQDAMAFAGMLGSAGFDGNGRLVYRGAPRFQMRAMAAAGGPPTIPEMPDSAAIFRVDLATRKIDTVGYIKTPKIRMNVSQDENGRMRMMSEINPLPLVDEWAMLPDGSVAIVRGRDYHIDWVNADGTRSSSPKIPFEWRRLSDEDKVAFIDSVKAMRERMGANAPMAMGPGGGPTFVAGAPAAAGAAAGEQRVMIFGPGGGGPPGGARGGTERAAGGANVAPPQMNFVPASELPDYQPPFFAGAVRADAQGNVWIRTIPTKGVPGGGSVYDVVNRKGELIDRVQVPAGRTIVGFAPNGDVYLANREGQTAKLEKATLR